jgi:hypothetical protein
MNCHTKLQLHLSRHMYKRGAYKGDAPADSSRRAKSHFRVIKGNGGQMIVRMHGADLITAYEDGSIKLDTQGWHASPTTRKCMNEALAFTGLRGLLSSKRFGGYSQTAVRLAGNTYRYYDRMEFSADGDLLTEPIKFSAKRTDREETAEFRKEIAESGFVGVFPVLYEAATPDDASGYVRNTKDAMCSEHCANQWPQVVALAKYGNYWARSHAQPSHENHKAALRSLIASQTRTMTRIVDLDVTVL